MTEAVLTSRLLIGKSPAVLELLSGKYKSLLIRRNPLFVLDFRLDIVNRVGRFNLEGNRLASQGLDKDLHTSAKTEDEMKRGFFLDIATRNVSITTRWTSRHGVLVGKSAPVLELLASKDQSLLVGRDTLLVLNLRLHIVDGVGGLDFEGDRFSRQSLDEDLHTTSETQDFRRRQHSQET